MLNLPFKHIAFFSPVLGEEKSYLIYLPDGYHANTSDYYPAVYFLRLHENEWFNTQWRNDGKALKTHYRQLD